MNPSTGTTLERAPRSAPSLEPPPTAAPAPHERAVDAALHAIRLDAAARGLAYAGDVTPALAWALASADAGLLVDIRTAEERAYVGRPLRGPHVPWAVGFPMQRNPSFLEQLAEAAPDRGRPLLLLCRSGKRSVSAAEAATAAGWALAFNVLEGFEGDLDPQRRRGALNGWRLRALPWVQD
jgi:rhodanese-related sulfurtransferase